jgi:putative glutamine amidotransferase
MSRHAEPGAPLVWVVASTRRLQKPGGHPQCYTVMDQAGSLTVANMGLQPLTYPHVPSARVPGLLAGVDGILLGGSDTNVHPRLYGEAPISSDFEFDPQRDALVQQLLPLAVREGIPVIAFCRGSHDFNVAFGGSLHQSLRDLGGGVQHWENPEETVEQQYIERHFVTTVPHGALARITAMRRFPASSLHSQGVRRLGDGLVAEAHADDGLVEAFRWHDERVFAWGFQFHPEWGWRWHPAYGRIMNAYVRACWDRRHRRGAGALAPQREITA